MAKAEGRKEKKITVLYSQPNTAGKGNNENDAEEKKIRAVAYCRVSSGSEEQLISYRAQIDYYQNYLANHPEYIYCGVYADEGISGTSTKKRDAFKRMMQDCRDGKLDLIITKSVSRFGRNTLDCLQSVRELKELGVDVYFEKENIYTMRSDGELLLTLMAAVAENESYTQSENVKWGIRRRYEQGHVHSIPSGKFLGYDKDKDGKLNINEEQAEVVRRIYQLFLDGYGFQQIANNLTKDNIYTFCGKEAWCISTIGKILRNEKLKGDTLCQKSYNADPITKRRVKNRGEFPKLYYENTHPAIVDRGTWELVQLELARQEQYCLDHQIFRYHNSSDDHPLSARITCSTCGRTYMQIDKYGRKYWRCSSFIGKHGTEIDGKTFTPKPRPLRSKYPDSSHARYRAKHRKLPQERQMLCTDIQIPADQPVRAFVEAWNMLADRYDEYFHQWEEIIKHGDALQRYRAQELMGLVQETGRIEKIQYELCLITLSQIVVAADGTTEVVLMTGTKLSFPHI